MKKSVKILNGIELNEIMSQKTIRRKKKDQTIRTLTSKMAANGAASISSAEYVVSSELPRDNNSPRIDTACEIYSGFFVVDD